MLERDRRNLKEAINWFVIAKQVSGDDPIILAELALTLEQAGNGEKAMEIATKAQQGKPADLSIAILFAKLCLARGLASKAISAIKQAIDSDPQNAEALQILSMAVNSTGTLPVPLQFATKLIQLQPQEAHPYATLATSHRLNGNLEDSLASYEHALTLDPSLNEAVAGMAEVLESLGRTDEAEAVLLKAPKSNSVLVALAKVRIARKRNKPNRALSAIDSVLSPSLSSYHQSNLLMHKGRVLEELQQYDEAWKCWEEGNKLHGGKFDLSSHVKLIDTIIDTPTTTSGESDATQPIFIIGMYRSGTTLLEQILGAHSEIDAAGEVDQLLRFVNEKPYPECCTEPNPKWSELYLERLQSNNKFCTDKLPSNYLHIGLIQRLFPKSKIIHTTRNPLDTCVSCFSNSFAANHAYTSDLHDLSSVYKQYERIMDHWNYAFPNLLYEVKYETLVTDFEGTLKGVLDHIGVSFDSACLEFYNVRRIAVTPSVDQVRKPIYDSSIGRHKHFSKHLGDLNVLQ